MVTDFSAVEHHVYEAAIVPELWPRALEKISAFGDAAATAMLCINERGVHTVNDTAFSKLAVRWHAEGWAMRSSRIAAATAKGLLGVPRFFTGEECFDPGEQENDSMTNELFRAEGFGWFAGFGVQLPHGDMVVMNVEQNYERGPICGPALDRLNALYPHLARAALFGGRADFERVRTAVETLTALGLPAVALTPSGKVTLANEAFNAATHVWTTRGGDKIVLHDKAADRMLHDSLAAISVSQSPRSVPVRAFAGETVKGVLHVVPIRRSAHDVFGSTSAIVVLSEAKQSGMEYTLIQSLFDLTPAELAVARSLAEGLTIQAIASQSGRSSQTVRHQLKSIMSKTGCTRQLDLVLLMRQLGQRR
jgi:DNA-binding CsgD family transcriptional regulator